MLKVKRIRVSKSLTSTLVKLLKNEPSVIKPSLLTSNIFKNLSLIIPGKLQY